MNKEDAQKYGREVGKGLKESMRGINTVASPKKKKTCFIMMLIPLLALPLGMIGGVTGNDTLIEICVIPAFSGGIYQFYLGKFKKGLIFTFTIGLFYVGLLADLFKLKVTGTLRDANGFPVIY